MKQRFRKIEKLDTNIDEKQAKLLSRDCLDAHSKDGMVGISFNQPWHEVESLSFRAAKEFGVSIWTLCFSIEELTQRSNH